MNFVIGCMPEDMALFHSMYRTAPKARREIASHLLSADDEFEISGSYTSRVAEIFAVVLKSLGLRLDFIDEEEKVSEYDDTKIKEFVLDDKSYLCTEYMFMLVKRKQAIEKELLGKYGVIDADELEAKVMEELYNRNYIIGPSKEEYSSIPAFWKDTAE